MNSLRRFAMGFAEFFLGRATHTLQSDTTASAQPPSHSETTDWRVGPVAAAAEAARFLTSRNHFNSQRVRPQAFMPNIQDRATSVFLVDGLTLQDIKAIGVDNNVAGPGRTLYGYAGLQAGMVNTTDLQIVHNEPPLRHADIVGWPDDKDAQMEKALGLANVATRNPF